MRHTTQTAVDGATVYYSFLYKLNNAPTGTANANGLPVEAIVCFNNLVPVGNTDVPDGTAGTILINTNRQIGINQGGGATANGTTAFASTQLAVGQAYLIVARYTFHPAGNDTIDLWVSPASSSFGVSPPTPDVTVTATGTGSSTNIPSLAYFTLYIDPGIGINYVWDEVRIDTTWPGVTPSAPDTITTFSGLTASQSIPYGTASITLGGKVSGTGPVYPPSGDTVAITINGHTVNGTVTDSTGDFSITYNDASLATLPAGSYAIGYQYAGNVGLNYSASPINTSTTLTVSYASPVLAIAVSGPNAIISWPSGADPGFILKSNIDLTSPATWATAGTPVVIGSQRVVTNAVVPSGLFYRLMK